jgi:hypothetical protein
MNQLVDKKIKDIISSQTNSKSKNNDFQSGISSEEEVSFEEDENEI